jgi:hypothetical protein
MQLLIMQLLIMQFPIMQLLIMQFLSFFYSPSLSLSWVSLFSPGFLLKHPQLLFCA